MKHSDPPHQSFRSIRVNGVRGAGFCFRSMLCRFHSRLSVFVGIYLVLLQLQIQSSACINYSNGNYAADVNAGGVLFASAVSTPPVVTDDIPRPRPAPLPPAAVRHQSQSQSQEEERHSDDNASTPSTTTTNNDNDNDNDNDSLLVLKRNDVNVLVLTDVHSWIGGHRRHEPKYNADYGDILSFYSKLKEQFVSEQRDLFFVMNGDFMDGTGLSRTPPKRLTTLLRQMPWDALTIGNHELYTNETVEFLIQSNGFIDSWEGNYITSNVLVRNTTTTTKIRQRDDDSSLIKSAENHHHHRLENSHDIGGGGVDIKTTTSTSSASEPAPTATTIHYRPIGERYKFLKGTYNNTTILTFGFLYDMTNNCPITKVQTVESIMDEPWFLNVLSGTDETYDAILILAHMDVRDTLLSIILQRIRSICGDDMPVQFITGHSHRRDYQIMDNSSVSFEAGRYLTTIGYVSFSVNKSKNATIDDIGDSVFDRAIRYDHDDGATNNTDPAINDAFTLVNNENNDLPFFHTFIDPNIQTFKDILRTDELDTPSGTSLSRQIKEAQEELGLFEIIGCSPKTYRLQSDLGNNDSLWTLFADTIIPEQIFDSNSTTATTTSNTNTTINKLHIQRSGSLRYDLFEGNVSLDDLTAVSPFHDLIYLIDEEISGREYVDTFGAPNTINPNNPMDASGLPYFITSGIVEKGKVYELYTIESDLPFVIPKLESKTNRHLSPKVLESELSTFEMWTNHFDKYWNCQSEPIDDQGTEPNIRKRVRKFFQKFSWVVALGVALTVMLLLWLGVFFFHRNSPLPSNNDRGGEESSFVDSSSDDSCDVYGNDWSEEDCDDDESEGYSSGYTPSSATAMTPRKNRDLDIA